MADPSAGQVGGVFAGIVAAMVALGHGMRWWLGWTDRRAASRSAKLEAWQKELVERERRFDERQAIYHQKIESELEDLRLRDERRDQEFAAMRSEHAAMRTAYRLIASALRRKDPRNPALGQADAILKAAFPPEPDTPADMLGKLKDMP